MTHDQFQVGEPVICRVTKRSVHPGPRAQNIRPDPYGDLYTYEVDKYWLVAGVPDPHTVLVQTRTGKTHVLSSDNPSLRKPRWWERLLYRQKFPGPSASS